MKNYMDDYRLGKRGKAKLDRKARYALECLLPKYSAECKRLRAEILRLDNNHNPLPEFEAMRGTSALADLSIACGLVQDPFEYKENEHGQWLQRRGYYYSPCEALA